MKFFLILCLLALPLGAQVVETPAVVEPPKTQKIFLLADINPINLAWSELGVENEGSFSDVLIASWLKWFSTQTLPANREVISCDGTCKEEFINWRDTKIEGLVVSEKYKGGQWIRVSFNLTKTLYVESSQEWQLQWDGRVVHMDVETKKTLGVYDLFKEKRSWRNLSIKDLNSSLASAMYRMPLDAFSRSVRKAGESLSFNRQTRLGIQGQKNISDVFSLIELLKKEGKDIHLDAELDGFDPKEAKIKCFYQGEEKSFTDLLSRLKELKSSHSYKLSYEVMSDLHILKLIAE